MFQYFSVSIRPNGHQNYNLGKQGKNSVPGGHSLHKLNIAYKLQLITTHKQNTYINTYYIYMCVYITK
jgi:hypothetical protein